MSQESHPQNRPVLYRCICQNNGYLLHVDGLEGTKNLSYVEFDKQFVNMVGKQMLAGKVDNPVPCSTPCYVVIVTITQYHV